MSMFQTTTAKTPNEYIALLPEPRRSEIKFLHDFIRKLAPELKPHIIAGMIGYGTYHYKYASGREGDWSILSLASRKDGISFYTCASDGKQYLAHKYKKELPKASIGMSCIRFKRAEDLDLDVLGKIIRESARWTPSAPLEGEKAGKDRKAKSGGAATRKSRERVAK